MEVSIISFLPPQLLAPHSREPPLRGPHVFPQLEEGASKRPSPGIQVPPTFFD